MLKQRVLKRKGMALLKGKLKDSEGMLLSLDEIDEEEVSLRTNYSLVPMLTTQHFRRDKNVCKQR